MKKEGWTWLINSLVNHYFVEKTSLCKKFMILGNPDYGTVLRDKDCKECSRRLEKRLNQGGKG